MNIDEESTDCQTVHSQRISEFFRKQETSCFRGKRNDSPPSKQSCCRPTISPLLLNPRRSRLLPAGHHWSELQGDQISPGRTPGHRASPPAGTKTTLWVPPVRTPPVLKPEIPAWKKTHDKLLLRYHLIANKSWPEQDKGTPHPQPQRDKQELRVYSVRQQALKRVPAHRGASHSWTWHRV